MPTWAKTREPVSKTTEVKRAVGQVQTPVPQKKKKKKERKRKKRKCQWLTPTQEVRRFVV
jgi:hypothetical protein